MPDQQYVLYCLLQSTDPAPTYSVAISYPAYVGTLSFFTNDSESDLRASLGRLGITTQEQNDILSSLTSPGQMFIKSGITVPDSEAKIFGIELHDGEMPDEANTVRFSKCSLNHGELAVNILLNKQIMPAPVWGCYPWKAVRECLLTTEIVKDPNDLHKMEQEIMANGVSYTDWRGIDTKFRACIANKHA